MPSYQGIASYLKFISETYRLQVCITDFIGFLNQDENLQLLLQPFLIHKSPFCMQIKSNRKLWDHCIYRKRLIYEKAQHMKSIYYGMCYCGIEEYIVPIICRDFVIGVISVGGYSIHPIISSYRIKKIAKENKMDYDLLLNKFSQSTRKDIDNKELIENLMVIVADNLASFYENSKAFTKVNLVGDMWTKSSETYILSHAVEYIKQHFHENISVKLVAEFCFCSESYISHIFKRNMKENIKAFINRLRVEEAKQYLLNAEESISEISSKVGFNDSNYFSSVFNKLVGMPPSEYRKPNRGVNQYI